MLCLIHSLECEILFHYLLQCIYKYYLFFCRQKICVYPYNIVSLIQFGLTWSYKNSYITILLNSSIKRPKLIGLFKSICVLLLVFFYGKWIFRENFCCMIIWFWNQIVSSCSCCYKFDVSMFSHIFHHIFHGSMVQMSYSLV